MTTDHRARRDVIIDVGFWAWRRPAAAATSFGFVSPPPGADLFPGADKVVHAIAFFATTLSFLLSAVWRPAGQGPIPGGLEMVPSGCGGWWCRDRDDPGDDSHPDA